MGQIADDMIDGLQCSWCGVMFETEHGFPVACHSCFDEVKAEDPDSIEITDEKFLDETVHLEMHKPSGVQRATENEL